jgi:hypothetical protein
MPELPQDLVQSVRTAFKADDAATIRRLLESHPELKAKINEPGSDFNSPLITQVRSADMLDVLLDSGADINARSVGEPVDSGCSTAPILS